MPKRSIIAATLALSVLAVAPASAESSFFSFLKPKETSSVNQKPGKVLRTDRTASLKKDKKSKKSANGKVDPKKQQQLAAIAPTKAKAREMSVAQKFAPQTVAYTGYKPGTIVIDTRTRDLYYVESMFTARKYKVAVGKEGLVFTGKAKVADKQEWPRWIPTADMVKRDPKKYGKYKDGMDGGPENPLGARAIYLYQGKVDTHIRIHGTTAPETIGTASSNGCFRMINEHVIELYNKVKMGAEVVVL